MPNLSPDAFYKISEMFLIWRKWFVLTGKIQIKFDRVISMSYVPMIQNDVDIVIFRLQQLKFLKLNQAHFLVLDVKDKMSRNCTFERSGIEVGAFHCSYPRDLI